MGTPPWALPSPPPVKRPGCLQASVLGKTLTYAPNFSCQRRGVPGSSKVCEASDPKSGNSIWDQLPRLGGNNVLFTMCSQEPFGPGPQAGDCKLQMFQPHAASSLDPHVGARRRAGRRSLLFALKLQ